MLIVQGEADPALVEEMEKMPYIMKQRCGDQGGTNSSMLRGGCGLQGVFDLADLLAKIGRRTSLGVEIQRGLNKHVCGHSAPSGPRAARPNNRIALEAIRTAPRAETTYE